MRITFFHNPVDVVIFVFQQTAQKTLTKARREKSDNIFSVDRSLQCCSSLCLNEIYSGSDITHATAASLTSSRAALLFSHFSCWLSLKGHRSLQRLCIRPNTPAWSLMTATSHLARRIQNGPLANPHIGISATRAFWVFIKRLKQLINYKNGCRLTFASVHQAAIY